MTHNEETVLNDNSNQCYNTNNQKTDQYTL